MCPFTEAEIWESHREEVRDPRKRTHRHAPWRTYKSPKGEPLPAKSVPPLPGMQRMNRASEMELLRRTSGDGDLADLPEFPWVCAKLKLVPDFGWIYTSDGEAGLASDSDIRREMMGTWLADIARWTHFCTWTFSRLVSVAAAMHFGRVHLGWLARWDVDTERGGTAADFLEQNRYRDQRDHAKDERARQKAARKRVQAFLATERGETGGLIHLHALVAKINRLSPFCARDLPADKWGVKCCMVHAWPCGYARVFPYDPALGAKYYVSKYVIKGYLAEWELMGHFHCPGTACSLALR